MRTRPAPNHQPATRLGLVIALLGATLQPGSAAAQNQPHTRSRSPQWVERETHAMGTRLRILVAAQTRTAAIETIERAFDVVRRYEKLLSTWRNDTELARLNAAAPGAPWPVTPPLFELLAEARHWTAETGGAFDPAVGPLIDAWDLRGSGREPGPDQLSEAIQASGSSAFELDARTRTVTRRHAAAWIDAGAFGKGAALRAARDLLADRARSALIDFGGQILAVGPGPSGEAWEIQVAHPARRHEPTFALRLSDLSAATTAASERFATAEGARLGHVVDPRSGRPVPAWGSVTVVARDPFVADLLSTALFVLGADEAMAWAAGRDAVGVLVLEEEDGGLRARWNEALGPWLAARPDGSGRLDRSRTEVVRRRGRG